MTLKIDTSDAYVRYESDALVLRLARFVWVMHLITAFLMGSLFLWRGELDLLLIGGWMLWMTGLGIGQGLIAIRGTGRASQRADLAAFPFWFDITAILLALGYGFLGFALVPTGDPDLDRFVGFIIGGGVLTGTGTHNPHYRMLVITLLIIIPALALRAYLESPGNQGLASALMLLVFLGLMLGLGRVLHDFTRRGFFLQWEKMQLASQLEQQAIDLTAARAEADAANEAKSKFLAQASHDLRQPLHSMGLFLASLKHEPLSQRALQITERLDQSVDVLSELFSSLLDVTLMDTQQTEFCPVSVAVRPMLEDIEAEFSPTSSDHSICVDCPDDLHILADPLILRRMIQNLVSNAIRHTLEGSICLRGSAQDGSASLSVQDSGAGIPEAEQTRIFREFERGLPMGSKTRGLGLGLSIVQRLAALSGINIGLNSSPGQGACFTLGPFRQAEPEAELLKPADEEALTTNSTGRVLIVDDHAPTLEATAAVLARWGWDMDARMHLSEDDLGLLIRPDLIITDFDLGNGKTGLDIIDLVRGQFGDIPALIISGSSTDTTRQEVKDAGLMLLHKPVRPVQLRSALIALMG